VCARTGCCCCPAGKHGTITAQPTLILTLTLTQLVFFSILPAFCRSLYPNVDFYSGIVLRALGIPVEMYTVLFAMARTVGWVAQVRAGNGRGGSVQRKGRGGREGRRLLALVQTVR
jgi:hypothetical protein